MFTYSYALATNVNCTVAVLLGLAGSGRALRILPFHCELPHAQCPT